MGYGIPLRGTRSRRSSRLCLDGTPNLGAGGEQFASTDARPRRCASGVRADPVVLPSSPSAAKLRTLRAPG